MRASALHIGCGNAGLLRISEGREGGCLSGAARWSGGCDGSQRKEERERNWGWEESQPGPLASSVRISATDPSGRLTSAHHLATFHPHPLQRTHSSRPHPLHHITATPSALLPSLVPLASLSLPSRKVRTHARTQPLRCAFSHSAVVASRFDGLHCARPAAQVVVLIGYSSSQPRLPLLARSHCPSRCRNRLSPLRRLRRLPPLHHCPSARRGCDVALPLPLPLPLLLTAISLPPLSPSVSPPVLCVM